VVVVADAAPLADPGIAAERDVLLRGHRDAAAEDRTIGEGEQATRQGLEDDPVADLDVVTDHDASARGSVTAHSPAEAHPRTDVDPRVAGLQPRSASREQFRPQSRAEARPGTDFDLRAAGLHASAAACDQFSGRTDLGPPQAHAWTVQRSCLP